MKGKRACPPKKVRTASSSAATRRAAPSIGNTRRSVSAQKPQTGKIAGTEPKPTAGEPAKTVANGPTIALPALRQINRAPLILPPISNPNERVEHEAFLFGFSFGMEALRRIGLKLPPDVWIDAQQVAFLMYPPFDPPSDIRKAPIRHDD